MKANDLKTKQAELEQVKAWLESEHCKISKSLREVARLLADGDGVAELATREELVARVYKQLKQHLDNRGIRTTASRIQYCSKLAVLKESELLDDDLAKREQKLVEVALAAHQKLIGYPEL